MTGHSSLRVKESESSEPRKCFEHDIELIRSLINQLVYEDISGVALPKVYRLGSQADLK